MEARKEWLEERRKGLGGSDSPVVLGVSPFKTRLDLWMEKRGLIEEPEATPAMKRGTVLEPVVAKLYQEATGRKLRRKPRILQHKKYPFLIADIDRQILSIDGKGPGVLEIKCPGIRVFSQCKRKGLPEYYLVQLQHYLEVTGRAWGSFAVFSAERWELIWFDVERDDEFIEILIKEDAEFWEKVMQGIPPEKDQPDKIKDLPRIGPAEIIRIETQDWEEAVTRLKEAQELREEAEELEEEAKARIQALMEQHNAQVAEGAGARIYWKWQKGRESIDTRRLKKEKPEIWEKYKKQGKPYRAFRPYFLKEVSYE